MASKLLAKLANRLFDSEQEREAFMVALDGNLDFAPCIIETREEDVSGVEFAKVPPCDSLSWLPSFVRRLDVGSKPGKHTLHDQGAFYCLDFSSVFAASVMLEIREKLGRILDVCAAPGGKTVFASRSANPERLIANEVIGKRLGILRHNLARCKIANAFTQRLDPAELARLAPNTFDLVIVDAPCSGQSLLAKGIENQGCFHPITVNHNARRQRRILAASAETVAPGGYLLYSTCTFSPEENEKVIAWFLKRFEAFQSVLVPHLDPWQSKQAEVPSYRLFPHSGLGAGAFSCLLRKAEGDEPGNLDSTLLDYPVNPLVELRR